MLYDDQYWMQQALSLALCAKEAGEVPVGACLVDYDRQLLLGQGWNSPIGKQDATAHAEINALREASKKLGNYRLVNTILFVTLEPCMMCYGALLHARVARVVFACSDSKFGVFSCHQGGQSWGNFNHKIAWESGVLAEPAKLLLADFFALRRKSTTSETTELV